MLFFSLSEYSLPSWEKTAFLLDFVQSPTPTPPQFGQLVQLFSDVEVQDLKDSLWLEPAYVIYMPPKKQLKVQINANYLEEIGSFIDQKCTSWKCDKKFGQGLPPPVYRWLISSNRRSSDSWSRYEAACEKDLSTICKKKEELLRQIKSNKILQ